MLNLDVDQLKTFLAIADTGSFTKTAEEVNKTQSTVSVQMKRLEDVLGKELFIREGRGSKLSIEGERFIEHARRMVIMNDEIVSSFTQPALTGTVRLGVSDDYAEIVLPEVLNHFSRSNPFVTVDVECAGSGSLKERVRRAEIDIAMVTFYLDSMEGEVLRREDVRWVSSPRHNTHLLPVIPIAVADVGCEWRRMAVESLRAAGKEFRIAYSSPNRAVIDTAVHQGLAIAVLPEMCLRPGMRILGESEGFETLGTFDIGLMRKAGKLSQAAEALAYHIRESLGRPGSSIIAAE